LYQIIKIKGRAPSFGNERLQALPGQLTPTRHPCGTQKGLLTAASSRTWRGS